MSDSSGLAVGDTAPDFTATLVRPDGEAAAVSLESLLDEKPVLLAFYTGDFSPDCIREWCSFRDYEWFASGEQVRVVGVSKSGPASHRRFIRHLDLGFPLYADTDLDVAEAFDVRYRAFKLSARSRRSCFLIDRDREIRYKWLAEHPIDPTRDTPPLDEVRDAVVDALGGPEVETFGFDV